MHGATWGASDSTEQQHTAVIRQGGGRPDNGAPVVLRGAETGTRAKTEDNLSHL